MLHEVLGIQTGAAVITAACKAWASSPRLYSQGSLLNAYIGLFVGVRGIGKSKAGASEACRKHLGRLLHASLRSKWTAIGGGGLGVGGPELLSEAHSIRSSVGDL